MEPWGSFEGLQGHYYKLVLGGAEEETAGGSEPPAYTLQLEKYNFN